jgi:hypothetical protein
VEGTLPHRPGRNLRTLAVDEVPVKLTTASVNIHLGGPEPSSALPEVTDDPESGDDEEGEVGLEELRSSTGVADGTDGRDSGVELWGISD